MAYVHCDNALDQSEFGKIVLLSLHGALVCVG